MNRFLALLLSLVLTLTLCACGGGEGTAHVGQYDCTSVTMGDVVIDTIEGSLDLQKGGKGTLTLSGETYDLTHTLEEGTLTLTIENDMIVFKKNGEPRGWWDGVDFHTGNIVVNVNERAQFGNFAYIPRSDGSLMFLKVGD